MQRLYISNDNGIPTFISRLNRLVTRYMQSTDESVQKQVEYLINNAPVAIKHVREYLLEAFHRLPCADDDRQCRADAVARYLENARTKLARKEYHDAFHDIYAAILMDGENLPAWTLAFECHAMLDDLAGMNQVMNVLHWLKPEDLGITHDRGLGRMLAGRWKQGRRIYEKAMLANPDPLIAYALGRVRWLMGNNDLAIEAFNQCILEVNVHENASSIVQALAARAKKHVIAIQSGMSPPDEVPFFCTGDIGERPGLMRSGKTPAKANHASQVEKSDDDVIVDVEISSASEMKSQTSKQMQAGLVAGIVASLVILFGVRAILASHVAFEVVLILAGLVLAFVAARFAATKALSAVAARNAKKEVVRRKDAVLNNKIPSEQGRRQKQDMTPPEDEKNDNQSAISWNGRIVRLAGLGWLSFLAVVLLVFPSTSLYWIMLVGVEGAIIYAIAMLSRKNKARWHVLALLAIFTYFVALENLAMPTATLLYNDISTPGPWLVMAISAIPIIIIFAPFITITWKRARPRRSGVVLKPMLPEERDWHGNRRGTSRDPAWARVLGTIATLACIVLNNSAITGSGANEIAIGKLVLATILGISMQAIIKFIITRSQHDVVGTKDPVKNRMIIKCFMVLCAAFILYPAFGWSLIEIAVIALAIQGILMHASKRSGNQGYATLVQQEHEKQSSIAASEFATLSKKKSIGVVVTWVLPFIAVLFRTSDTVQLIESTMAFFVPWIGSLLLWLANAAAIMVAISWLKPAIRRYMKATVLGPFERVLKRMAAIAIALLLVSVAMCAIDSIPAPAGTPIVLVMVVASCIALIALSSILHSLKNLLYPTPCQESRWQAAKHSMARIPTWMHFHVACAAGFAIDAVLVPSLMLGILAAAMVAITALRRVYSIHVIMALHVPENEPRDREHVSLLGHGLLVATTFYLVLDRIITYFVFKTSTSLELATLMIWLAATPLLLGLAIHAKHACDCRWRITESENYGTWAKANDVVVTAPAKIKGDASRKKNLGTFKDTAVRVVAITLLCTGAVVLVAAFAGQHGVNTLGVMQAQNSSTPVSIPVYAPVDSANYRAAPISINGDTKLRSSFGESNGIYTIADENMHLNVTVETGILICNTTTPLVIANVSIEDMDINTKLGIMLDNVRNANITGCILENCQCGIDLVNCKNVIVSSCNLSCSVANIEMVNCSGITIAGNAFSSVLAANKTTFAQLAVDAACTNIVPYDAGPRSGNFWSDYKTRYPHASNNAIIWNETYTVAGLGDLFPLVMPFIPNMAPAITDIWVNDTSPCPGDPVEFDYVASSIENISLQNCYWQFAPGSMEPMHPDGIDVHAFPQTGTYTVTAVITTTSGTVANRTCTITVVPSSEQDTGAFNLYIVAFIVAGAGIVIAASHSTRRKRTILAGIAFLAIFSMQMFWTSTEGCQPTINPATLPLAVTPSKGTVFRLTEYAILTWNSTQIGDGVIFATQGGSFMNSMNEYPVDIGKTNKYSLFLDPAVYHAGNLTICIRRVGHYGFSGIYFSDLYTKTITIQKEPTNALFTVTARKQYDYQNSSTYFSFAIAGHLQDQNGIAIPRHVVSLWIFNDERNASDFIANCTTDIFGKFGRTYIMNKIYDNNILFTCTSQGDEVYLPAKGSQSIGFKDILSSFDIADSYIGGTSPGIGPANGTCYSTNKRLTRTWSWSYGTQDFQGWVFQKTTGFPIIQITNSSMVMGTWGGYSECQGSYTSPRIFFPADSCANGSILLWYRPKQFVLGQRDGLPGGDVYRVWLQVLNSNDTVVYSRAIYSGQENIWQNATLNDAYMVFNSPGWYSLRLWADIRPGSPESCLDQRDFFAVLYNALTLDLNFSACTVVYDWGKSGAAWNDFGYQQRTAAIAGQDVNIGDTTWVCNVPVQGLPVDQLPGTIASSVSSAAVQSIENDADFQVNFMGNSGSWALRSMDGYAWASGSGTNYQQPDPTITDATTTWSGAKHAAQLHIGTSSCSAEPPRWSGISTEFAVSTMQNRGIHQILLNFHGNVSVTSGNFNKGESYK